MEAVGLRELDAGCILSVFQRAQLLAQQVEVRLATRRFTAVNSTKGVWLLLEDLMSRSQAHSTQDSPSLPANATSALSPVDAAGRSALLDSAHPKELVSAFTLDKARKVVLCAVKEVLGDGCHVNADGQFSSGEILLCTQAYLNCSGYHDRNTLEFVAAHREYRQPVCCRTRAQPWTGSRDGAFKHVDL